jgi:hypothetical protein
MTTIKALLYTKEDKKNPVLTLVDLSISELNYIKKNSPNVLAYFPILDAISFDGYTVYKIESTKHNIIFYKKNKNEEKITPILFEEYEKYNEHFSTLKKLGNFS